MQTFKSDINQILVIRDIFHLSITPKKIWPNNFFYIEISGSNILVTEGEKLLDKWNMLSHFIFLKKFKKWCFKKYSQWALLLWSTKIDFWDQMACVHTFEHMVWLITYSVCKTHFIQSQNAIVVLHLNSAPQDKHFELPYAKCYP